MKILVVEDDELVGAGVAAGFAREGWEVERSRSGEEALERAACERHAAIVLDIGLPGIDGFEILRRLRECGSAAPVLMLTARDAVGDRVRGLDLGADDYMVKPFAMPELVARVRALMRRAHIRTGEQIVHGPLTLDCTARRAYLNGAPLELTAREWAVLEVLIERTERTVPKEAIIAALAGSGEELTPNAIEVYVSRLRAKLDRAGIRIQTVRGFGYLLAEYSRQVSLPPCGS